MSAPSRVLWWVIAGVAAASTMIPGAGCGRGPTDITMAALMASVDDPAELDQADHDIATVESGDWVELFDPGAAWSGYNLDLYKRRVPMVFDMNGRIVHSWPKVRAVGRIRLDRSGRLAVIGTDDVVKEYDWDGRITWAYRFPDPSQIPHHDLIQLANGNYLVLGRVVGPKDEFLHEVDRSGRVVWEWNARDHLPGWFGEAAMQAEDPTHINSVNELSANRWFDAGDERFRPGNLLLSARSLDAIFIIDRISGDVVWSYGEGLDHQHEALMIPSGQLGEGLVIVFDNGYQNRFRYRQSRVVVIDPVVQREVWSYQASDFYSSVGGSEQPLANGNVLITSSQGGRVFEVDPAGAVVWQWIPPFQPMRAVRLPYDYCPQLAALPQPVETAVDRSDRPRWFDDDLSRLTIPEEHVTRELHGKRRQLVPFDSGCRELVLPAGPVLRFGYGLDPSRVGNRSIEARFTLSIGGRQLHRGVVRSGDEQLWHDVTMALDEPEGSRVTLCVATEVSGYLDAGSAGRVAFWENPSVFSSVRAELRRGWRQLGDSRGEDELQRRQLEAIGYVQ